MGSRRPKDSEKSYTLNSDLKLVIRREERRGDQCFQERSLGGRVKPKANMCKVVSH